MNNLRKLILTTGLGISLAFCPINNYSFASENKTMCENAKQIIENKKRNIKAIIFTLLINPISKDPYRIQKIINLHEDVKYHENLINAICTDKQESKEEDFHKKKLYESDIIF